MYINKLFSIMLVFGLLYGFTFPMTTCIFGSDQNYKKVLNVMPWQVGQFVEYQIISMEGEGKQNRYRISLVGQETISGKVYFWVQVDIYEYVLSRKGMELKKNITFQILTPPLTTEKFTENPAQYISNGFSPCKAIKLRVQIFDGPFIEVNPTSFFSYQQIIEDTPYSITPEAMGKIDFSRMGISKTKEKVLVPAGSFECEHIFVNTDVYKEYWDEGFDLWRNSEVPFLGIVKMEFSNTLYWEKWSYRNETKSIKTIKDFLLYLYRKRVPGRRRPDTHIINLVSYGQNSQNKK